MNIKTRYRLVTRSDFDGLVCAVLLKELDLIDDIKFVHPKDVQDGQVQIFSKDITTNLPYVESAFLCIDHHDSEVQRVGEKRENHIIDAAAPSAARVVYNHFGGKEKFPRVAPDLMEAVDKADAARFTLEEVLHPQGWALLNFVMDPRTGLGRFKNFTISNYQLMMDCVELCRNRTIEQILRHPDIKERVDLYEEQRELFKEQLQHCSRVYGSTVILDLRNEEPIHCGNRFVIYALYPECSVSVHVMWGLKKRNTVFAAGKSIFNRSAKVNLGALMLELGGGGHAAAATCQVANEDSDAVLHGLIEKIRAGG